MAVFLNEDHIGHDAACIGFPHILLCMAVVIIGDKAIYGAHLTMTGEHSDQVITGLKTYLQDKGANIANASALYGCCNRNIRHGRSGSTSKWKTEMRGHAASLGYKGPVYGFDTSIISPKDGTYIEFHPDYTKSTCSVFYKREEKMDYGEGVFAKDTSDFLQRYSTATKGLAAPLPMQASATVKMTASNKGQLHEVNYCLRMTQFTV